MEVYNSPSFVTVCLYGAFDVGGFVEPPPVLDAFDVVLVRDAKPAPDFTGLACTRRWYSVFAFRPVAVAAVVETVVFPSFASAVVPQYSVYEAAFVAAFHFAPMLLAVTDVVVKPVGGFVAYVLDEGGVTTGGGEPPGSGGEGGINSGALPPGASIAAVVA